MLKTLLAIGLVSALGGGSIIDNDAPYGMPRYASLSEAMIDGGWSEVTSGDHAMVLVPALGVEIGPFAAADMDALVDRMLSDAPEHVIGGHRRVVTDNGAPGGTFTTKWTSQEGEQIVTSKKGASEDEDDFVKRHANTVRRAQKAFPPI